MEQLTSKVEVLLPGEQTFSWEDLSEDKRQVVALIHAAAFRASGLHARNVLRLFNLGRPKVVFGPDFKYCRIHKDSVDVMKIITANYLR